MNVGSLFSGAGLMDWGLTLAGFDHAWFCESDPYCRRILERRWPGVPIYDDVRELREPEPVDLLAGGFPCQPFSAAGKQLGKADERWLWPEFARLVRDLRPRYVLVENVPGLLAGHGGMGAVLGDLAALGYDAEWDCLPASAFSAPHQRDRVWIVAYSQDGQQPLLSAGANAGAPLVVSKPGTDGRTVDRRASSGVRIVGASAGRSDGPGATVADSEGESIGAGLRESEPAGERRRRPGNGSSARDVQDADGVTVQPRRLRWRAPQTGSAGWWAAEPDVGRVAHGVPHRLDRLRAIGNGVVPQVAQWIGERIIEAEAMSAPASGVGVRGTRT